MTALTKAEVAKYLRAAAENHITFAEAEQQVADCTEAVSETYAQEDRLTAAVRQAEQFYRQTEQLVREQRRDRRAYRKRLRTAARFWARMRRVLEPSL